jgi:hypothetical protein
MNLHKQQLFSTIHQWIKNILKRASSDYSGGVGGVNDIADLWWAVPMTLLTISGWCQ